MAVSFPIPVPVSAPVVPVAHRSDVLARLSADASVLKAMGLSRCAVFGSFARDQAIRPDSDVDLLVSFSEPVGFAFIHLADHLETLLGRRVDLVASDGIKENRRSFILSSRIPVAP